MSMGINRLVTEPAKRLPFGLRLYIQALMDLVSVAPNIANLLRNRWEIWRLVAPVAPSLNVAPSRRPPPSNSSVSGSPRQAG